MSETHHQNVKGTKAQEQSREKGNITAALVLIPSLSIMVGLRLLKGGLRSKSP